MKMKYDLLNEKEKKKVDDFLEECKNNKKGWDAKKYYMDLYCRGYLTKFPLNQSFIYDML